MIIIPANHASQRCFGLLSHISVGRSPTVRDIGHNQDSEPVGPVKFSRYFDLDVNSIPVQADAPAAQYFVPHEFIAGESIKTIGMIRLVQRQLQIYRLIVQRDIGKIRAGKFGYADFSHAEVCGNVIFSFA